MGSILELLRPKDIRIKPGVQWTVLKQWSQWAVNTCPTFQPARGYQWPHIANKHLCTTAIPAGPTWATMFTGLLLHLIYEAGQYTFSNSTHFHLPAMPSQCKQQQSGNAVCKPESEPSCFADGPEGLVANQSVTSQPRPQSVNAWLWNGNGVSS